jgi:hypothetical protein
MLELAGELKQFLIHLLDSLYRSAFGRRVGVIEVSAQVGWRREVAISFHP